MAEHTSASGPLHRRSDQGSVEDSAEPRFLVIGRVVRPHGVRGELRVAIHTQLPERFTWLDAVYLSRNADDAHPERLTVHSVRFHKGYALIRLGDYTSRGDAEVLRGYWLLVPEDESIPLEEDEAFHYELEGLAVYTDDDEHLGTLSEILETGANEVFVVRGERGEILLPNIEEVVIEVDLEGGRMVVHLLPGLIA